MFSIIRFFALICLTFSFTHASLVRSKKRKASTILRDANNHVEPVQPLNNDTLMQSTPQQQRHVVREGNVIHKPFRVKLVGGKFSRLIPLSHVFTTMTSAGYSPSSSNITFGDHVVGLCFYCTQDTLSMRFSLSSFTKGQITIQLKVFMNTGGITLQETMRLNAVRASLADGMNMPVCRLYDIHNWVQNGAFVNLHVEMFIDPAHYDILLPFPSHDQGLFTKFRTVSQHINGFLDQGKYKELIAFSKNMSDEEFLTHVCKVIRTFEQYKGLVDYMESRNLVASFFVHGDMKVVKMAAAESKVNGSNEYYIRDRDFGIALQLTVKEDRYDRFVELFSVRIKMAVEDEVLDRRIGWKTRFEIFMTLFLQGLVPWEKETTFKRFLTLHGKELRDKHPDILDILCQKLVDDLKDWIIIPMREKLLTDLIGQPFLLTPMAFTRGCILHITSEMTHHNFIKYAWREAIQESLKREYRHGGAELWEVMKEVRPTQVSGEFPETADALDAVLKHFQTKEQLEEEWAEKNASRFREKLESLHLYLFPTVLWTIIAEYGISSWLDVD